MAFISIALLILAALGTSIEEKENAKLRQTNRALTKALEELMVGAVDEQPLSGEYNVVASTGGCPGGLALTEQECKSAITTGSTWTKAATWQLPESCGCFIEGNNQRYFNRLTGACNRPDSGERMICKKATCAALKLGACSKSWQAAGWVKYEKEGYRMGYGFSKEQCLAGCVELAEKHGEGCCQYGPGAPGAQSPVCRLAIGDSPRDFDQWGPTAWDRKQQSSSCTAA